MSKKNPLYWLIRFASRVRYYTPEGWLEAQRIAQIRSLRQLCAAAYQMAGCYDAPVEFLDNLSAAAQGEPLPHEPYAGLPVVNQWREELDAAQSREDYLNRRVISLREAYEKKIKLVAQLEKEAAGGSIVVRITRDAAAGVLVSHCPALNIYSQGETEEEALEGLKSAVSMHLSDAYDRERERKCPAR